VTSILLSLYRYSDKLGTEGKLAGERSKTTAGHALTTAGRRFGWLRLRLIERDLGRSGDNEVYEAFASLKSPLGLGDAQITYLPVARFLARVGPEPESGAG
jgi:hypothetical protein